MAIPYERGTEDRRRIVCFGDSLTVGYQSPTRETPYYHETPYGAYLSQRFGGRADILIRGVNGEMTADMVSRFLCDVMAHGATDVVILGGTNDLGAGCAPAAIMQHLSAMYEMAERASIRPIAVTVPAIRLPADAMGRVSSTERWYLEQSCDVRRQLNALLHAHCAARCIVCVDLHAATVDPGSGMLAAVYDNDGVHLSTAGYERLAALVWEEAFSERPM